MNNNFFLLNNSGDTTDPATTGKTAVSFAGITLDGLTPRLTTIVELTPGTHTLSFGVVDALDSILDSSVFLTNLRALNTAGGVGATGQPPAAADDDATADAGVAVAIDVLANDTDPDDAIDPASVVLQSAPADGTVTVDPATGQVTYTSTPGFAGTATFSYVAVDVGGVPSNPAIVSVDVSNQPPVAVPDKATVDQAATAGVVVAVTANDADPNGGTLVVTAVGPPANGVVTVTADSQVSYVPSAGFAGTETLTYEVADEAGLTATGTVTIAVIAAPADAGGGGPGAGDGIADGPGGDDGSADGPGAGGGDGSGAGSGAGGGAGGAGTGTGDPGPDGTGTGTGGPGTGVGTGSGPGTIVTGPNRPPELAAIGAVNMAAGTASPPITLTLSDAETPAAALIVQATASDPQLLPDTAIAVAGVGGGRTLILTPPAGRTGSATVTVTDTDEGGLTASREFRLNVVADAGTATGPAAGPRPGANTPPVLPAIPPVTVPAGAASPVPFTVSDAETRPRGLAVQVATSDPQLLPEAGIALSGTEVARTLTLTPPAGRTGTATVTVTVTDEGGLTASQQFLVTVVPAAPVPVDPGPAAGTGTGAAAVTDTGTGSGTAAGTGTGTGTGVGAVGEVGTGTGAAVVGTGTGTGGVSVTTAGTPTAATPSTGSSTDTTAGTGTGASAGTGIGTGTGSPAGRPAGGRGQTLLIGLPDGAARVVDGGAPRTVDFGFGPSPRTAAADVTGDGVPDLIGGTGPGQVNLVRVIDGATGRVVFDAQPFERTFGLGVYVAAADLDGDGRAELVVTPDRGGGPRVVVVGSDGRPRASFFGIADPDFRGGARAALADVSGDGVPDLVVSAGFLGGPRIAVLDGRAAVGGSAAQLAPDFFAFEDTLRNGAFVAAGDVTGDGAADLVFGGGPTGGPRVRAVDGRALLAAGPIGSLDAAPGLTAANFFAGPAASRGGVRVVVKDVDGDGRSDVVTGSGDGEAPRVRVFSGAALATGPNGADIGGLPGGPADGGVFVG